MYKTIVIPAAMCLLLVAIACNSAKHNKTKRLPGTWQITPITVDGNSKDWPSPYPEYDSKAMLGYAVSNDKDNLYITVETGDPATQLKLLKEGFTIWIDKTGGQEQVTGINFPLPNHTVKKSSESEERPAAGQWQQGRGGAAGKKRLALEDKVSRALGEAKEYSLQGFKACNLQFPVLEQDSCGIVVRIDIDADNELVWEAVVPFRSFYYKREIGKMDNGKPLSVCFETVGAKRPAGQAQGGGRNGGGLSPRVGFGGMGGMGMGMRMGGGHTQRGGGSGAPDNTMESLYKSTTTWKTFGIAFPQH